MLALLPAILSLAPALAEYLAGDRAASVASKAVEVVRVVTGTTDPEAIANLPPDKRVELQLKLGEIAAETRRAELADVANARALTGQSRLVAWAQVVGGAIVLFVWCAMVLRLAMYGLPYGTGEMFATVLAAVSGVLGGITQFFYGNATSAQAANRRLDMLASLATNQTAPASVMVNQQSGGTVNTEDLNASSLRAAKGG